VSDRKWRTGGTNFDNLPPDAFLKKIGEYEEIIGEPFVEDADDSKL